MTPYVTAHLAPIPPKVKAVVLTHDYVHFRIVVSEYLCEESRQRAFQHELQHIYHNHFSDDIIPIGQLEQLANQPFPGDFRYAL